MRKLINAFLRTYTFQRQLSVTITFGIIFLAMISSLVESWQSNDRVRRNILEQGELITENLARQSTLALIYESAENAADAVKATMAFPGVIRVEIHDVGQHTLLTQGTLPEGDLPAPSLGAGMSAPTNGSQAVAVLDAESRNSWRFIAPVYTRLAQVSPFAAQESTPELLGYVVVVMRKTAMKQIATDFFISNLAISLSFALLFLLLIRYLTRRMTSPLNELSINMGRAEAGESQVRVLPGGPKDIAAMAYAFNSMMTVLEERAAALRVAAISFEVQEGMMVIDANKIVLRVNHAFSNVTGYSAGEVIGKFPHVFGSEHENADFYAAMWETVNRTGVWEGEIRDQRNNGEIYPERLTVTAVRDLNGTVTNYVVTLSDITERKKSEAALAANQAKSDFLANMSHEIRTPMNGVIGMVDILRQTELNTDQHRMLNTIQDSSQSLLRILNDILDFSKIEAGKLEVELLPTRLREVIESVAQILCSPVNDLSFELYVYVSPQLPEWISADPTRLRQTLYNLLGNAAKFTSRMSDRPGRVMLRAEPTRSGTAEPVLSISIADNGIGMSPEVLAKLFQPFTQADESITRKFGGTGLGLSITLRLVELMGGRMSVCSTLDKGSEFMVELPLKEVAPDRQLNPEPDLSGIRVLAVTGNPLTTEILASYCRAAGVEVTIHAGLDMAQAELRRTQSAPIFHVVLLDQDIDPGKKIDVPESVGVVQLVQRGRNSVDAHAIPVHTYPLFFHDLVSGIALASGRLKASDRIARIERRKQPRIHTPTIDEVFAANRLILLAEDNEINREVMREQLQILGHNAEIAEDGRVALKMWRSNRYALLLTDCHMPNMDGFDLTAAIRFEEAPGKHLPIIAVTANAMLGEAERCIAKGMDGYLSKPLRMHELETLLEKWLPLPVADDEMTGKLSPTLAAQASKKTVETGHVPDLDIHDFPVWDTTTLTRMVGDNPDMHTRILEKFLINAQGQVDTLHAANAAGDTAKVGSVAHSLKSAARTVGAMQLGELCQEMEMAERAGDSTACSVQVGGLKAVFDAATEKIRQVLG